jgi:hypothetical protein
VEKCWKEWARRTLKLGSGDSLVKWFFASISRDFYVKMSEFTLYFCRYFNIYFLAEN